MTDKKSNSSSSNSNSNPTNRKRSNGVVFMTTLLVGTIVLISCICYSSSTSANATSSSSSSLSIDKGNESDDLSTITIEDFSVEPINKWTTMNDPVMGGKSHSSLLIDNGVASFEGTCAIVPFLHAPGFITMVTGGYSLNPLKAKAVFPDVSSCTGVKINIRSKTEYDGYYISFGTDRAPGGRYARGYKSPLKDKYKVPVGVEFKDIIIPFNEFSSNWDDATGETKISCKDDNKYCPTVSALQNMKTMSFWGEGVEGDVALDIRYIGAVGCSATTTTINNGYDSDSSLDIAISSAAGAVIDNSQEQQQFEGSTEEDSVVVASSSSLFLDEANESSSIKIEDFSVQPINEWTTMNDPVMGGKSHSSLLIDDGVASFEGTCAIVPFLHAPGFITMITGNPYSSTVKALFPDVSSCKGVKINVRSKTEYDGYYMSFGTDRVPGGRHAMGYKSPLEVPFGLEFKDITIPFNEFSSNWDEGTGKTKITCKDDNTYCPTISTLQNMKTMTFWGEGVEGDVALDIRYIGAVGCSATITTMNMGYDSDAPFDIATTSAASVAAADTIIDSSSQKQEFEGVTVTNHDDVDETILIKLVNFSFVALFSIVVITILASFRTSYRRIVEKESYEELKGNSIDYDTDDDDEVKEEEHDTKTVTVV